MKFEKLIDWEQDFRDNDFLDWESWEGFWPQEHISIMGTGAADANQKVHQRGEIYADVYLKTKVAPKRLIDQPIVFSRRQEIQNIEINEKPYDGRDPAEKDPVKNTEIQYKFHIPGVSFNVLAAYINNSPCKDAGSGKELWNFGVTPDSKFYSKGNLSDGPTFSEIEVSTWCPAFSSLMDGRLVVINNMSIYLETSHLSGEFEVVATIPVAANASFLKVSPGGTKIALGIGYGRPLTVFNVSLIEEAQNGETLELFTDDGAGNYTPIDGVSLFDVGYYDAIWWDDSHLLINTGTWPGPPYMSGVGSLDISTGNTTLLIGPLAGASGGMCLDNYGNLITGIGYGEAVGDIYVYKANDTGFSEGTLLCTCLSAGHMVIDLDNNLFVGGGDWAGVGYGFGTPDPDIIGHLEKIPLSYDKIGNITAGDIEEIFIDECQDDTAAGPLCLVKEKIVK